MSKAKKPLLIPNVDALTEIYGISNTPSYLYRQFRRNDAIFKLGAEHTARALAGEITRVLNLDAPTLEENVAAIASAIALGRRPIAEMQKALASLPKRLPTWLQQIVLMVKQSKISDAEVSIILPYAEPLVTFQSTTSAHKIVPEKEAK